MADRLIGFVEVGKKARRTLVSGSALPTQRTKLRLAQDSHLALLCPLHEGPPSLSGDCVISLAF
jgi:hypothetical protein